MDKLDLILATTPDSQKLETLTRLALATRYISRRYEVVMAADQPRHQITVMLPATLSNALTALAETRGVSRYQALADVLWEKLELELSPAELDRLYRDADYAWAEATKDHPGFP